MIDRVKKSTRLQPYVVEECSENGVCVTFSEDIHRDDYVIIKVDGYYNSLNIEKRPASPDCLIIRRCQNGGYGLTLVELKDVSTSSSFTVENMREKFNTCFNDFIKKEFRELLDVDYKDVKIFFVSNIELYKRDMGLKLEVLINIKFKFNEKNYMIYPQMPSPTIKSCY